MNQPGSAGSLTKTVLSRRRECRAVHPGRTRADGRTFSPLRGELTTCTSRSYPHCTQDLQPFQAHVLLDSSTLLMPGPSLFPPLNRLHSKTTALRFPGFDDSRASRADDDLVCLQPNSSKEQTSEAAEQSEDSDGGRGGGEDGEEEGDDNDEGEGGMWVPDEFRDYEADATALVVEEAAGGRRHAGGHPSSRIYDGGQ